MRWIALTLLAMTLLAGRAAPAQAWDPEATVLAANQILQQQADFSIKQIPDSLLADAQGVAIIPDVFKIGFVAAIRRGHGVVMVRDANGVWSLPQFITLTGGSVGWQAGVQGTDVLLVFRTKKSIDGLLSGKFTLGADASAAAGPVGRNASAATDARFKAEILSYSRSRGLFAGVSLDGSAIEMNPVAQEMFYGAPAGTAPTRVPESALKLVQEITTLTEGARLAPPAGPGVAGQPAAVPMPVVAPIREQLAAGANQMNAVLPEAWRQYLALPPQVFAGAAPPSLPALQEALARYDKVAQTPAYESLYTRPEFQNTYAHLRDYVQELEQQNSPTLALPPPPGAVQQVFPRPASAQQVVPQPLQPQPVASGQPAPR